MKKEDTVRKYEAEFLAGRSEEAVAAFRAKSVDRQYSSIMTWRYSRRKAQEKDMELINPLRELRRKLAASATLRVSDLDALDGEVALLAAALAQARESLRAREIEDLERRRREIEDRLRSLRED